MTAKNKHIVCSRDSKQSRSNSERECCHSRTRTLEPASARFWGSFAIAGQQRGVLRNPWVLFTQCSSTHLRRGS